MLEIWPIAYAFWFDTRQNELFPCKTEIITNASQLIALRQLNVLGFSIAIFGQVPSAQPYEYKYYPSTEGLEYE